MPQTTSCLQLQKMIPLPVSVESHALAEEWEGELWLLINQPGNHQTQLLKITSAHAIESIAVLPIIAASMTCCDQQMIISGSNADGRPLIIGLNAAGLLLWEYVFSDISPIVWPITGCGLAPTIAWQQHPDKIELGVLDTNSATLLRKPAFNVEVPPAKIFSWKNKVWGAWADKGTLHVVDLVEDDERVIATDGFHANEFSVGQTREGVYFGWTAGNNAFWLLPESPSPGIIDIENIAGGTFCLISGGEPLGWIQKSKQGIGGELEWESTLVFADLTAHTVDGYVFTIAWWQQQVVVVSQSKILLFRKYA